MKWIDETKEGFGRYFPTVQNILDRVFDTVRSFFLKFPDTEQYFKLPRIIANSSRKIIYYGKFLDEDTTIIKIKGRPKLTALIRDYTDQEIQIRIEIFKVLAKQGDQKAILALVRAIGDSDYEIRKGALEALKEIQENVIYALKRMLLSPDKEDRRSAANVLGHMQELGAVVSLVDIISDSDASVRIAVVKALGEIWDAYSVSAIIERLKDEDPGVVQHAFRALEKFIENAPNMKKLIEVKLQVQRCIEREDRYADGYEKAKWQLVDLLSKINKKKNRFLADAIDIKLDKTFRKPKVRKDDGTYRMQRATKLAI